MKHLKKFEFVVYLRDIAVGDHVLLYYDYRHNRVSPLTIFLNETIGQIEEIYADDLTAKISYENVPKDVETWLYKNKYYTIVLAQIKYHAKTKEEVEAMIASEKYNL